MTLNLKCCVENQSDFFYGDLDWFSNKFSKFIINLCRNLNKSSITLINYLRNKLIILHVSTCVQSYIYICTRMYTMLIYGVHNRIRMNTTNQIKIYGEQAKEIHEGDIYIASVDSVEGRTVVTLKPKGEY